MSEEIDAMHKTPPAPVEIPEGGIPATGTALAMWQKLLPVAENRPETLTRDELLGDIRQPMKGAR